MQNWGLSIIFLLVFPIVPLGLEGLFKGDIPSSSVQIVIAIYAFTLAPITQFRILFGIDLGIGFLFAATYGHNVSADLPAWWQWVSYVAIIEVFLVHMVDRYYVHAVGGRPFFEFEQ